MKKTIRVLLVSILLSAAFCISVTAEAPAPNAKIEGGGPLGRGVIGKTGFGSIGITDILNPDKDYYFGLLDDEGRDLYGSIMGNNTYSMHIEFTKGAHLFKIFHLAEDPDGKSIAYLHVRVKPNYDFNEQLFDVNFKLVDNKTGKVLNYTNLKNGEVGYRKTIAKALNNMDVNPADNADSGPIITYNKETKDLGDIKFVYGKDMIITLDASKQENGDYLMGITPFEQFEVKSRFIYNWTKTYSFAGMPYIEGGAKVQIKAAPNAQIFLARGGKLVPAKTEYKGSTTYHEGTFYKLVAFYVLTPAADEYSPS